MPETGDGDTTTPIKDSIVWTGFPDCQCELLNLRLTSCHPWWLFMTPHTPI